MPNLVDLFGAISLFGKLTIAVGMGAFGLAVVYVSRPTEQKLVLMRPISLAAIFATVSGLLGGWIALLAGIAATPDGHLPVSVVYALHPSALRGDWSAHLAVMGAATLASIGCLLGLT